MTEHWSTPNGCHADCPACATDAAKVAAVEYYAHSASVPNSRVATVVRDKTTGNHALYVGNDKQWASQLIDAGVLECRLGPAPFMLRSASVTLGPDVRFPDTLDACLSSDTDAVKTINDASREWATAFVEKNNRFPHAIDYANAGYGIGNQCDCVTVGECVLRDACNGHHCDRNCYTQQLKDYIVMSGTKRAAPRQEDSRPATVEALLARIRTMIAEYSGGTIHIPRWAEDLLLLGAHLPDVGNPPDITVICAGASYEVIPSEPAEEMVSVRVAWHDQLYALLQAHAVSNRRSLEHG